MTMQKDIIKAALFTPTRRGWGLPVVFWGEPGIAKSSVIIEVCADLGLPVVVLSPGEMGEGAFGVVPVPGDKSKRGLLTYPAPEWTEDVKDGGVVFVDEIVCCPPAIAPALQGLLLDGRVGGTKLEGRVRMLAAANPPELATTGYEMSPPNANRCGHVNWPAPSVEEHTAWMLAGAGGSGTGVTRALSGDAAALEARVLAAWPAAWARAAALETSFLRAQPGKKNACPKPDDPGASRAWPSDRSWENATRALASAQIHKLDQKTTEIFVEAFVGGGAAREFFSFIEEQDLPDAASVLDGRVEFKHARARLDRTVAVINGTLALLTSKPDDGDKAANALRKARAERWWALLDEVCGDDRTAKDVVIPPCRLATKAGLFGIGGTPLGKFLKNQAAFLAANKIAYEDS